MILILISICDGVSSAIYIYFSEITSAKIRNAAFGYFFLSYYIMSFVCNLLDYIFTDQ